MANSTLTAIEGIRRIAAHVGFEELDDVGLSGGRLHMLGENILVLMLMLATNPASARLSVLARSRKPIYLSRRKLQHIARAAGMPERSAAR